MPPKTKKKPPQQQDAAAAATAAAAPAPSPKQQAKARTIQAVLDHLYPDPPIPLDHTDNFTLLIAVILSAQTTDGKVNQVTPELFRLAPTPQALAALPYDKVLSIIRPVGLAPGKSKNITGAAKMICERFGGQVPSTFDDLEALPGVGHKTASVVMTQAFGFPTLPVDTHVHRLALRWALSKSANDVKKVEADLKALYPPESWAKLGLQMIYFGREFCAAKTHTPSQCPICSWTSGSKPAPVEGKIAEFLASFGPSPAKASKHIILYSERAAVEGTAMLGPVTLKMEAKTDTQVKVEVKEDEAEMPPKKQPARGRRGAVAAVKTEITTTTMTATTTTKVSTTTAGSKRRAAGAAAARAPAKTAAAAAAAGSGKMSRKRGAPAASVAPAAATRAGKRAKRN